MARVEVVQERTLRRRRIDEFDVMRGVAIVLVVYLHAWFSPWDVTPHHQKFAVHVIHLFGHSAVPVFFFMSAFLLARDTSPSFRAFGSRKLRRIVVPTLFWMGAAFAYRLWQDGWSKQLGIDLALFNVAGQYYYLVVLAFFMASFYFARHITDRSLDWLLGAAFVVNLATVAYYERHAISGEFATLAYRNPGMWIFSYMFGYWAGRRFESMDWTGRLVLPAIAAMAGVAAWYLMRGEVYGDYPVSYFGITVFLFASLGLVVYPAIVRLLLRSWADRTVTRPALELSRYSFAIYLVHLPFFAGWLSNRLLGEPLQDDYWRLMNTEFIVGIAGSVLFAMLMARIAPGFSERFMGIERAQRAGQTRARTGARPGLAWPSVPRPQRRASRRA
ncbi:MAG: acyltransferase [Dehalococcoidia bacterium]|nr:acyltransferase [Dehalococcoidia bacterium]